MKITAPVPEQNLESWLLYAAFGCAWFNAWLAIGLAVVGAWFFWPYFPARSITA